jgi:hypothetical protein
MKNLSLKQATAINSFREEMDKVKESFKTMDRSNLNSLNVFIGRKIENLNNPTKTSPICTECGMPLTQGESTVHRDCYIESQLGI